MAKVLLKLLQQPYFQFLLHLPMHALFLSVFQYTNLFRPFDGLLDKTITVCQSRKDECLDNAPPGHFVPRCKADGSYEERQCLQSTGECWCVDRNGNELPGTRSKQTFDCSLLGESYSFRESYILQSYRRLLSIVMSDNIRLNLISTD